MTDVKSILIELIFNDTEILFTISKFKISNNVSNFEANGNSMDDIVI